MNLPDSFSPRKVRWRQRIGALQIRRLIRELEGGNPLPPQSLAKILGSFCTLVDGRKPRWETSQR